MSEEPRIITGWGEPKVLTPREGFAKVRAKAYKEREAKPETPPSPIAEEKALAEKVADKLTNQTPEAFTFNETKLAKSAAGRIMIRQALRNRGIDPDTIAEMVSISAEVGRGEGFRTNPTTGQIEEIGIHDAISQKAREHVTDVVGKAYELDRKEDQGERVTNFIVVFSNAYNDEPSTGNTEPIPTVREAEICDA